MQTRRKSLEEIVASTAFGLVVSTILNHTVTPAVLHTDVSASQNLVLTAIFTVASIARGYLFRRFYNKQ